MMSGDSQGGDPNYVFVPGETDIDGLVRIVDGDCDLTATVDMGAYEFDWKYVGDFKGNDCDVDMGDIALVASNWLSEVPKVPEGSGG